MAAYDKDKNEITVEVGSVAPSDSLTLTMQVENTGGSDLILRNPVSRASYAPFFGAASVPLAVLPILREEPLAIPPGQTGNYEIVVAPPDASGSFSAQIEIKTNVDVSLYYFSPLLIKVSGEAEAATLAADFDGDGEVGFSDFLAFAGHFGSQNGDAGYEAVYDLDASGDIGFSDFLQFAAAFGSAG